VTMRQKIPLIASILRWFTQNVSNQWGMRIIRRLPRFMTDFETETLYKDVRFRVFTGETIGRHLFYSGAYETVQIDAFLSLVSERDLIFDAGANMGIFSLLACKQGAFVVAFEPSLDIYKRLNTNIKLNRAEGTVKAVNSAVANECPTVLFFEARYGNQGVGRIFSFGDTGESANKYIVTADTLDNYAQQHGTPQLIKIDIEGAEWLALIGAKRLMSLKKAPKFFVEFHPQEMNSIGGSVRECVKLFQESGYLVYQLSGIMSRDHHSWYLFSKEYIDDFPATITK
jgi:FkbM family methyltransferase